MRRLGILNCLLTAKNVQNCTVLVCVNKKRTVVFSSSVTQSVTASPQGKPTKDFFDSLKCTALAVHFALLNIFSYLAKQVCAFVFAHVERAREVFVFVGDFAGGAVRDRLV